MNELLDTMTMAEYAGWCVFFEEKAINEKRAENRAAGIIDFSDPASTQQLIGMVHAKGGGASPGRKGDSHG